MQVRFEPATSHFSLPRSKLRFLQQALSNRIKQKMRAAVLLLALAAALAAKDPTECEVCIASLNTIKEKAKNKKDHLSIEEAVDNYCAKPASDKENKLVSGRML